MGPRLVIVGGGRMGEALLVGVLRSQFLTAPDVAVVEAVEARRDQLRGTHVGVTVTSEVPPRAEGIVLAVKPGDAPAAARATAVAQPARVLSIMAGVSLSRLGEWLGSVPVVRAMPNTPALIGQGAAAIAAGPHAGPADLEWAEAVLGSVGTVVRVTEKALDAVTGLSGSGPAYVFLVAEALIDAGVHVGLDRNTSAALVRQTLVGASRLLDESGDTAEALRAAVTSPGGTTAAGLRVLEQRAVRAAFLDAVVAASERSAELGRT